MTESEATPGNVQGSDSAAVETLRRAIVRGQLSPNEHLVESVLAQRFGFSRGAIRQSLLELAHEGLVQRQRNRGARVRTMSFDEAIELTEVRMVLEGLCAAKAAERATEEDSAGLWEIFEQMRRAASSSDLVSYAELNTELHSRIWAISGHRLANEIVTRLRNQGVRYQFLIALVPGRPTESLAEHSAIISAIAAGDVDRARRSMELHLSQVIGALLLVSDIGHPV